MESKEFKKADAVMQFWYIIVLLGVLVNATTYSNRSTVNDWLLTQ